MNNMSKSWLKTQPVEMFPDAQYDAENKKISNGDMN